MGITLLEAAKVLDLKIVVAPREPEQEVVAGYASDLLSCVMARACAKSLWITLQTHPNIVAVATLLDISGIIVAENAHIEEATIVKAEQEGVSLFSTPLTTYSVIARLAEAGLPGVDMCQT